MSTTNTSTMDEKPPVGDHKPEAVEERESSEHEHGDDATDGERSNELQEVKTNESQKYPSTKALFAIIPALLLAVFLMALDRTIIATAIPRITDEFHSLGDVGWYASAYLLTFGAFQLLFGRIYTFYNPKWVMIAAIIIFEVGSAVCGAAPNSVAFIIGRAIAGLGASGILGGGIVIIVYAIPLHKRPVFQGLFGAVFGVASVAGPLLGGVFTSEVSWRWCFYINLPIGGVSIAIIALFLTIDFKKSEELTIYEQFNRLDPIGTSLLVPAVVCLLLALQWGGTEYAWDNFRVILCLVLFGVLIIGFGIVQVWKQELATLPPRIAKNRTILAAMFFSSCYGGVMMIYVYYIPIWFQAIKGSTPVHSGIQSLPSILSLVVGSLVAGVIVQKSGYYVPMMYASVIAGSVGAGLICTWQVDTNHPAWIGYQFLWGFGYGLGFQQPNIAAQAVVSRKDAATGISFVFFGQTIGGAIFTSVGQNVFTNKLVEGITSLGSIDPQQVVRTGATDLRADKHLDAVLDSILVVYNRALVDCFYVGVALSCAAIFGAIFIEWKNIKKDKPGMKSKEKKAEEALEEAAGVKPE